MKQLSQTLFAALITGGLLAACTEQSSVRPDQMPAGGRAASADDLFIVDCLLPGQVRKLGSQMTYLSARRPIQTTAQDCEIRGGEYVAYDRASYRTALNVWMPRAEQGDPDAQNKVGEIYEKGLGTEPDYEMAALWYRRAAKQGFSRAQVSLGFLYEKGLGVPQDDKIALDWYRKSTKLPDAVMIDKKELESTRAELANLKSELNASRGELNKARDDVKERERQLQRERIRLRSTIKELENRPTSSGVSPADVKRVAEIRKQVDRQQRELKARMTQIKELESNSRRQQEKLLLAESEGASLREQLTLVQGQMSRSQQDLEHYQNLAAAGTKDLERTRSDLAALAQSKKDAAYQRIRDLQNQLERQEQTLGSQRKTLDQWKRKTVDLENQLMATGSQSQSGMAILQGQLAQARAELESAQKVVQIREGEIGNLRSDLDTQKEQQSVGSAKLTELESQLKAREQALAENQEMVTLLRKESAQWKQKLAQLEKKAKEDAGARTATAANVPMAPPSIQLIDPPLMAMRGAAELKVAVTRGLKKRNIVGQVTAPAGLFSLTLNGAKTTLDDKGLFQADIALQGKTTPINLVAIDKRGKRAHLAFSMVADGKGKMVAEKRNPLKDVDIGKYYALVIGNQAYTGLPPLDTSGNDAKVVAKVLKERFGFNVTLLRDATRYQILSAMNKFRKELTDKDNLVIYYAGHGELDRVNLRGHWLPVDAEMHSTANWISNVAVTDVLNAMSVRHVLVVADSCYSGALTRSALSSIEAGQTDEAREHYIRSVSKMRSRTVLTSGGLAPVLDGGGGAHSVFAKAFLNVLRELDDVTEGQRIFREVAARVAFEANRYEVEQVPQYAPIKFAGHESGDFLFVPKRFLN